MELIKAICPKCGLLAALNTQCVSCQYDLADDGALVSLAIDGYNEAVRYVSDNLIKEAWHTVKRSLDIYPFIIDHLNLALLLAIEIGEYQIASNIIFRLNNILTIEEYNRQIKSLTVHVDIYNKLIKSDAAPDVNQNQQLSCCHKYLMELRDANRLIIQPKYKGNTLKKGVIIVLGISIVAIIIISGFLLQRQNTIINNRNSTISITEKEMMASQAKLINITKFYMLFNDRSFMKCADLLISNPSIAENLNKNDLRAVTAVLYKKREFDKIVKIGFPPELLPHAQYRYSWHIYKEDKEAGVQEFEKWLVSFPSFDVYTAQVLLELISYYEDKDKVKATKYARDLETWIKGHSDNAENIRYMNSRVKRLLDEL